MDHAETRAEAGTGLTVAGRYELIELVGSGGMAEVWRARDDRLSRDVALKLLSGAAVSDASRRRRLAREARALAAISDPNIVSVYDYGEWNELPFIAMELVDGPDLHRYIAERGPVGAKEGIEVLRGVLSAVGRAHAAGIVHGDLKPANVFIGPHGPKVGDFGVARILDEETGTTTVAATPTFAAPEVLRGDRATPVSDVYSAACLAFQMFTGRAPYEGRNAWDVTSKHLEAPVPSMRDVDPAIPLALDAAVRKGMDKDPRRRFQSAAAFAAELDDVPSTMPIDNTVPVAAPPDATEALSPRPDAARIALLGPLARVGPRASALARGALSHARSRPLLFVVLIVLLVVFALFAFRHPTPATAVVPDVRGASITTAVAKLQDAGFKIDGVSYRPASADQAGLVVETIPAGGGRLARGSPVHVVGGAIAATPQPVVTPAQPARPDHPGRHKHDGGD